MLEPSDYVLRGVSGRYFVRWTGIGPMNGSLEEAARFPSEAAAKASRAYGFPLDVYRVEAVPVGRLQEDE